jgi:hypothetical protein
MPGFYANRSHPPDPLASAVFAELRRCLPAECSGAEQAASRSPFRAAYAQEPHGCAESSWMHLCMLGSAGRAAGIRVDTAVSGNKESPSGDCKRDPGQSLTG